MPQKTLQKTLQLLGVPPVQKESPLTDFAVNRAKRQFQNRQGDSAVFQHNRSGPSPHADGHLARCREGTHSCALCGGVRMRRVIHGIILLVQRCPFYGIADPIKWMQYGLTGFDFLYLKRELRLNRIVKVKKEAIKAHLPPAAKHQAFSAVPRGERQKPERENLLLHLKIYKKSTGFCKSQTCGTGWAGRKASHNTRFGVKSLVPGKVIIVRINRNVKQ